MGFSLNTKGGKRQVAIEPNIVPFIDLMSVLIIFLLITAVWSQVSMIQIGSSIYGQKNDTQIAPITPDLDVPFRIDLIKSGYRVIISSRSFRIPKIGKDYDAEKLNIAIKDIKKRYPQKTDAIMTLWDEVAYNDLIVAMDSLLEGGFPEVVISTIEVK